MIMIKSLITFVLVIINVMRLIQQNLKLNLVGKLKKFLKPELLKPLIDI